MATKSKEPKFEKHTIEFVMEVSHGLYYYSRAGGYQPRHVSPEGLDMDEIVEDIPYSSDSAPGQGFSGPRYKMGSHDVPTWITPEYYVKHHIEYRSFVGLLWDSRAWFSPDLNEKRFWKLMKLEGFTQWVACALLGTNPARMRSEFRKSLRRQVMAWLDDDEPEYEYPLSRRQLDCLNRDADAYARHRR